jgi:hypothetical protein
MAGSSFRLLRAAYPECAEPEPAACIPGLRWLARFRLEATAAGCANTSL